MPEKGLTEKALELEALVRAGAVPIKEIKEWADERWVKLTWASADLAKKAQGADFAGCTLLGTTEAEDGAAAAALGTSASFQLNLKPFLDMIPESQRFRVMADAFVNAGLHRPVDLHQPKIGPASNSMGNRHLVSVTSGKERVDAANMNCIAIELVAGFKEYVWVAPVGDQNSIALINDGLEISDLMPPFAEKLVAAFRGLDPPIEIHPYILPTFRGFTTVFGGHMICFAATQAERQRAAAMKAPPGHFESVCKGGLRVEVVRSPDAGTGQRLTGGPVQVTQAFREHHPARTENKQGARPLRAAGAGGGLWWVWILLLVLLMVGPVDASGGGGGGELGAWAMSVPVVVIAINVRKLLDEQQALIRDWMARTDPDVLVIAEPDATVSPLVPQLPKLLPSVSRALPHSAGMKASRETCMLWPSGVPSSY